MKVYEPLSKVERAVAAAEDDVRTAQIGLRSVGLALENLHVLPLLGVPFVCVFPPRTMHETKPGAANPSTGERTAGRGERSP